MSVKARQPDQGLQPPFRGKKQSPRDCPGKISGHPEPFHRSFVVSKQRKAETKAHGRSLLLKQSPTVHQHANEGRSLRGLVYVQKSGQLFLPAKG